MRTAESLLGPWLAAVRSSNDGESAGALRVGDLLVEARVKGGKASQSETLALAQQIVAVREHLSDPFALARSLHNLGLAYEERGESSRATDAHQRAVAIVRPAASARDPSLASGLEQLARALIGQERFADAQKALEEARAIRLALHSPKSPEAAQALFLQALLHRSDGDYEKATALLDEAGPRLIAARPQHPDTVAVLQLEGDLLLLRGRDLKSTVAKWTEALELSEKTLGPEHPHVAVILRRLATCQQILRGPLGGSRASGARDGHRGSRWRGLPERPSRAAERFRRHAYVVGRLSRGTAAIRTGHGSLDGLPWTQPLHDRDGCEQPGVIWPLRWETSHWRNACSGRPSPTGPKGSGRHIPMLREVWAPGGTLSRWTGREQEASAAAGTRADRSSPGAGARSPGRGGDHWSGLPNSRKRIDRSRWLLSGSGGRSRFTSGGGVPQDPDYFARALQLRAQVERTTR